MISSRAEREIIKACAKIGITINGNAPFDIKVHDKRFFDRVVREQSIGLGESYMEKWWDCDRLDLLFEKIYSSGLNEERISLNHVLTYLASQLFNFQSPLRSKKVCEVHYDLGNELYEHMLGSSMVYTCGYWNYTHDLEEAQKQKMDLACRKMNLKPGQRLLDIGCGFGSFMIHAAKNYGVECVGITLSQRQYEYAREKCRGLPIEVRLEDYRSTQGNFDRIISIGMFEAVGQKNYRVFMEKCDALLTKEGALLLHTIGLNKKMTPSKHWVDKYIFPRGHLPSLGEITTAVEGIFRCDDVQNFGPSYDKTLMAWYNNIQSAWPLLGKRYDEEFQRMWNFYLLSFAGGFRTHHFQLWQLVLAKPQARLSSLNEARIFP